MHIECNKNNLINAINIVLKAVPTRSTMDILSCILLIADRDGFRLIGNDLKLSIETTNIDAEVFEKGAVALDAKIFSDIIRNLPTEYVTLKVDEKFNCTITSGKSLFNIKGLDGEQFPKPETLNRNIGETEISSAVLKNMIKQTIFSVAVEDNRPILTGELLKFDENQLHVVAIDGYRVSWRKAPVEYQNYTELVVPAKTLNEICRLLPDDDTKVKMVFSAMHIMFIIDKCTVVSRLLDGDYLNYENLFNSESPLVLTVHTQDLLTALSRATIIADDSKKTEITLTISDRFMNINANTSIGTLNEDVAINIESGEDLVIRFNAKYLIDVLNAIDDEYVKLHFNTNKSPCIVTGITGDRFKYLVLPINPRS